MSVLVPIDVALRRTESSHAEGLRVRSNDGVDTCAVPAEVVKPGSPTFNVPMADGAPVEVVFVSIRSSAIEELDRDAVPENVVMFTVTPSVRVVVKVFNAIETSSGDQAADRRKDQQGGASSSRTASPTLRRGDPVEMNLSAIEGLVREMRDQKQEMALLRSLMGETAPVAEPQKRKPRSNQWDEVLPTTREQRKVRIQAQADDSDESDDEEDWLATLRSGPNLVRAPADAAGAAPR